jgi:hypothetical protein
MLLHSIGETNKKYMEKIKELMIIIARQRLYSMKYGKRKPGQIKRIRCYLIKRITYKIDLTGVFGRLNVLGKVMSFYCI